MTKELQAELDALRDIIIETVPVERILLFGSHINGIPNEDSDIDLYVVIKDDSGIREIDAMKLIRRAIRDKKTMPVDVVVGKAGNFAARKDSATLERDIAEEGLVLYR